MTAATAPALLAEMRDAGVRCHCGGDDTGHHIGVTACEAPRLTRTRVGPGPLPGLGGRLLAATGTCCHCGRVDVKVDLRTVRTAPDGHDLMPGMRLADVPALAAHRRGGAPCPGTGTRPSETRYRFPELEAIVRAFGPAAVTS